MTVSHSIQKMFTPRGVAVIGSSSEGKIGYELIRQLVDGGYEHAFAVNPKAQGALSAPGYAAVAEIDPPVDLAVIASPPATVPGVLEDCGQAGVGAAVIITAGFSETGNHAAEETVTEVAHRHGIRFVGPNCAGIVNTAHRLYPTLETRPPAGGVSLIAQSGAVGGVLLAWAREQGLGISKFVSYGNKADLNEIDFLRYLADDDETQVVALYIESVSAGRGFMEAVQACVAQKPVVVIKSGRTQSGQRATLSHTGSMAGADAVYDAALRQCGAIRVHTIEEMFDLCKAFTHVPALSGKRCIVITNSGGPGVMAADRAEEVGLTVAEPSATVKDALAEFLPPYCAFQNPIDLTVEGSEAGYRETLATVLAAYDMALALNIAPPYLDSVPLARGVCDAASRSDKPIVASFLPRPSVDPAIDYLQDHGVPNFATGERAVAALARMAHHGDGAHEPLPELPAARGPLPGEGQMLEPQAMAWLRENDIPVPAFRFAETADAAVQAAAELGYPVVMKVVSPQILHKSDYGGVILGIQDSVAAREAFARIARRAQEHDFRGVVIYPMIKDAREVLLGLSIDPQFGPVVAFGLGGIYTEVWRDIALRVAPVSRGQAEAMIREIRSFPLLEAIRGQEARDLDALADVLVTFSRLPFLYPEIGEIDLNPVFLFSEGLAVGDVRVIRRSE